MIVAEFIARTPTSREYAGRAARVLPDGVTADTRLAEPYGIYIDRATGVRKWDVDGNEYRDFFGGHGAMMLGHSHPRVTEAIQCAVPRGVQFAASHPSEVQWAELIQRHIPTAERVRFTASGTEATLLAIRIARAFTQRTKLIRISTHYHGWHDFAVSGYNDFFDGAPAPGVLPGITHNTVLVPPGDGAALQRAFETHSGEIAALIMEPLGCHFGIIPTCDSFLTQAYALAKRNEVPVVLDEVITAFRVSNDGMQGLLGLKPDLTCMGKVAAGGMPGGIVCGSEAIMSVLCRQSVSRGGARKKVLHQGTFTGNPLTANAALVTIDEIVSRNLCEHASRLGELTRLQLNALFRRSQLRWRAYGRYSAFHILPDPPAGLSGGIEGLPWEVFAQRSVPIMQSLRMALNLEGVDIASRATGFVSGVHQEQDVEFLVAAFARAIERLWRENLLA
jgi:glutamate-1-semialdehyde 2,1-aminomutase